MEITFEQLIVYFGIGFIIGLVIVVLLKEEAGMEGRTLVLLSCTVGWSVMLVILICYGIPYFSIKAVDWSINKLKTLKENWK